MRRLGILFTALLALSACGMERAGPPAPVMNYGLRSDGPYGGVTVQNGDTVWKISQRYRLSAQDIIDVNGLAPPYALSAGQRLSLPAPVEHKVGDRDTLYALSRMYGVSVESLIRANNLKSPYRLRIGQVVRIPENSSRRPAPQLASYTPPESSGKAPQRVESATLPPPKKQEPVRKAVAAPAPKRTTEMAAYRLSGRMPGFSWPVRGRVISSYGPKNGRLYNDGINIAAPRGTPVMAAADGVVAYTGSDLSGYGNLVLIRHDGGMTTAYAHLNNISVSKGARIRKGQPIGAVGSTGTVAGSQLHFEIRKGTRTFNPEEYLG